MSEIGEPPLEWLFSPDADEDGRRVGVGAVAWGGGSWYELVTQLEAAGCLTQALWLPEQRIGWHGQAPDFVNHAFTSRYGDGQPLPSSPMAVVCAAEANTQPGPPAPIPDYGLGETQMRWITYPEINTPRNKQGDAVIQFGGGSQYQLVSRLSIEGCNANELMIGDTHYSYEHTNEQNQAFTEAYKQHIPGSTNIRVACVDNCDIIYGLDLVQSRTRQILEEREKCRDLDLEWYEHLPETLVSSSLCGDNWSEEARQFFAVVPVFQDTCKIDLVVSELTYGGQKFSSILINQKTMYQPTIPSLYVANHTDPLQRRMHLELLRVELHELCHVHQEWYTFKEYTNWKYLSNSGVDETVWVKDLWTETPMATDFNEIVGFEQNHEGDWSIVDSNSIYNREFHPAFRISPLELSAELCFLYLLRNIEPNSSYERRTVPPYITPEIEAWIEQYIVLPRPPASVEG